MDTREQFTLARRYLRTVPSLFNLAPALPRDAFDSAYGTLLDRPRSAFKSWRVCRGTQNPNMRGKFGCQCKSCAETNPYTMAGFQRWPHGEPAGKRASDKAYSEHEEKFPKPWRYVSRPPQFSTYGQAPAMPSAPKWLHDWINARGPTWKDRGPTFAGPDARPAKPAKAKRHFREPDRRPEAINHSGKSATIYAMPKSKKSKRSRGRPSIPGRFVVVKLEERLILKAEKLGGKVSAGIREALERVKVG